MFSSLFSSPGSGSPISIPRSSGSSSIRRDRGTPPMTPRPWYWSIEVQARLRE